MPEKQMSFGTPPAAPQEPGGGGQTPMSFTRKRVLVACEFCRHRKRRCDGERPSCSTCLESNADCVYKEHPSDKLESSHPSVVAERLSRIETLLEEQAQRLDEIAQQANVPARTSSTGGFAPSPFSETNTFALLSQNVSPQMVAASASVPNRLALPEPLDARLDQAHFLIPRDHSTSANSLLDYAKIRSLLGEYPADYFYTIEENLPLPPALDTLRGGADDDWPSFPDEAVLESLADRYFAHVHPHFPIFTRQSFLKSQALFFEYGPQQTPETAISLCVYALGCLVSPDEPTAGARLQHECDSLALQFFQPCLRIIVQKSLWDFRPSIVMCQALVLCSAYFSLMGRPLHSWKMVYSASSKYMSILDQRKRSSASGADDDDSSLRVFWSCFMVECDRAAELEIVRSGIEPMADRIPLPRSSDDAERDGIHYFVAETAIRRILNRIHCSLYTIDHSVPPSEQGPLKNNLSLNTILTLSSELNRQLEEWYSSIPAKIRPPKGTSHVTSDRGKVLRIRYYAAKHIIHRPFILYAALQQNWSPLGSATPTSPQPQLPMPKLVLERCETCISSCQAYLYNAAEMLGKRSPYLWTFAQNSLACFLVLLLAESCPQLRHIVPDWAPLQGMIIPRLRKWATKGSSFEAQVRIMEKIARGTQAMDSRQGIGGSLS